MKNALITSSKRAISWIGNRLFIPKPVKIEDLVKRVTKSYYSK